MELQEQQNGGLILHPVHNPNTELMAGRQSRKASPEARLGDALQSLVQCNGQKNPHLL